MTLVSHPPPDNFNNSISSCVDVFAQLAKFTSIDTKITEKIRIQHKLFKELLDKLVHFTYDLVSEAEHVQNVLQSLGDPMSAARAQRKLGILVARCSVMERESESLVKKFNEIKDGLCDLKCDIEAFSTRGRASIKRREEIRDMALSIGNGITKIPILMSCVKEFFARPFFAVSNACSNSIDHWEENLGHVSQVITEVKNVNRNVSDFNSLICRRISSNLKSRRKSLDDFHKEAGEAGQALWAIDDSDLEIELGSWKGLVTGMQAVSPPTWTTRGKSVVLVCSHVRVVIRND